ncbi:hypothetical protein COL516b_011726 [Colletotrichum fioriniae]|nr:uncharacterized protein COL516b_011726 [Colletotrichum fioriniae]KAJ0296315.1 hypothetical protein COL516b_011726 [Colletotrichum fioriniae]
MDDDEIGALDQFVSQLEAKPFIFSKMDIPQLPSLVNSTLEVAKSVEAESEDKGRVVRKIHEINKDLKASIVNFDSTNSFSRIIGDVPNTVISFNEVIRPPTSEQMLLRLAIDRFGETSKSIEEALDQIFERNRQLQSDISEMGETSKAKDPQVARR